jgi:hypothetical protein
VADAIPYAGTHLVCHFLKQFIDVVNTDEGYGSRIIVDVYNIKKYLCKNML